MKLGIILGNTIILIALLTGCSETQLVIHSAKKLVGPTEQKPKPKPPTIYKVGNPYQIFGAWYYPAEDYDYDHTGIASWYGPKFHGRKTANGEIYDMNALTAAHRTLPMPSFVRVSNLENGRSLVLRINDRGPFARVKQGRIIDVSRRGAQLLGFQKQGTARVRVEVLAEQSQEIKAHIINEAELGRIGSPIKVKKMPKPLVQRQVLQSATKNGVFDPVSPEVPKITQDRAVIKIKASNMLEPSGRVTHTATTKTHIYVQVGSYTRFDNASRVRAKLNPIGSVRISQTLIDGRDFYRVRVGPLSDVAAADRALETISRAGFKDAQIIVD